MIMIPSKKQPLKRIAVALSGGIDSSVAANLLSQLPNVDLVALHMSNWNSADEDGGSGSGSGGERERKHKNNKHKNDNHNHNHNNNYCQQSEQDANDAQSIADHLGIRMTRVEFQSEYWHGVFEPFLEGLEDCRMVNPDVGCNSVVKFGAMRKYAMEQLGADYIATGHYARLWHRRRRTDGMLGDDDDTHSHNDIHDALWNISSSESMYTTRVSTGTDPPKVVQDALNDHPDDEWIQDWGMSTRRVGTSNVNVNGGYYGYGNGNHNSDDVENIYSSSPLLLAGADASKDQSYFLCGVHAHNFSNVLFPLGNLHKNTLSVDPNNTNTNTNTNPNSNSTCKDKDGDEDEDGNDGTCTTNRNRNRTHTHTVREMAAMAFPTNVVDAYNKKESMGICFIGKRNFADFISEYLPNDAIPGDFVDVDTGKVVGQHRGAAYYTIGQGAKISGASCKWFTAQKDRSNGTVYVCNDTHHPSLYSDELYVAEKEFHWINGEEPHMLKEGKELMALCRTRHLQPLIPCVLSRRYTYQERGHHHHHHHHSSMWVVKFDRPVRGITPGQTAAIYVAGGLVCLGGGQISHSGPTYHELGRALPSQLHPAGSNDLSVHR